MDRIIIRDNETYVHIKFYFKDYKITKLRDDCYICVDSNNKMKIFIIKNIPYIQIIIPDEPSPFDIRILKHDVENDIDGYYYLFGVMYTENDWNSHELVVKNKIEKIIHV